MDSLLALFSGGGPAPLGLLAALLLFAGGAAIAWPALAGGRRERSDVRRRLRADLDRSPEKTEQANRKNGNAVREKAARTAQQFYAKTDPENVARLRLRLIQAGYMDPRAVGTFFLARFAALAVAGLAAFIAAAWFGSDASELNRVVFIGMTAIFGYFLPGLALSRKIKAKVREYRNGFPDFMDLMVVCCDAGMSMEASVERVAKELGLTYPSLSQNLQLVTLELRAGRSLDDALKALADRLCLEEVRSFATLLQQSKELGTSLSGALRVFSDEMRHKRMSIAEEKAHALPAKMSVPVTVCILPVVMMIAIIPIIVKLTSGHY